MRALFKGLGAIVMAIVLNALINFGKPIFKDWKGVLIAAFSFLGCLLRLSAVLFFVLAAGPSLLLRLSVGKPAPGPSPAGQRSTPQGKGDYVFLVALAALIGAIFVICYLLNGELFSLSLTLSKTGALAFGGGFTIIPLIQYEVVDKYQWVSTKEFLDGIAMGQVTPGPIMITATFLGYKLSGFWGGIMATLAIFSPAFFIVALLIPRYDQVRGMSTVRMMEQGILPSFIGMLALVFYNFGRTTFVDIPTTAFAVAAFMALLKKVDLAYILAAGAILSVLVFGLLR